MEIPNLVFTTEDGVEVKRFFNKYVDCFGGVEYKDVYDSSVDKRQLARIGKMMLDKPKTYSEYLKYIQANVGGC